MFQDKGKDEAYTESREEGRRLAGLRQAQMSTRFDDPTQVWTGLKENSSGGRSGAVVWMCVCVCMGGGG